MHWWIWLIIIVIVVGVVVAAIMAIQARRRTGGVISARGRTRSGDGS